MAAPASLSPAPVVGLGSFSYSLFEDDYAVNKNVLKAKATTALSGVVNYKFQSDSKGNSQEVKVQFPYKRYYVWTGFRKDTTKVHVDFGEFNFGKTFRLYANDKFPQHNVKFGAVQESPKCTSHTRVEYTSQPQEWKFTSRAHSKFNNFHLVFAGTFNLTTKRPNRYDLLFGYNQPKYDVFFRHYSNSTTSFKLGRLVADFVYKRSQGENYGVEFDYNPDKRSLTTNLATSRTVNGYVLKAKANPETYDTFVSVKGKLDNRFSVTLSAQSPIGKSVKNDGFLPFPFSVTLETTV